MQMEYWTHVCRIGRLRSTRLHVEMRKLASLSRNSKTDEHQVEHEEKAWID